MVYENALAWVVENLPPQRFDSFNQWYNAVDRKLNTPALMSNPTFNRMLENAWSEITGTDSEDKVIQRVPSRDTQIKMPMNPRVYFASSKEMEKKQEVIVLPQTGRAPEIPRPILVFPREQMSEIDKIKKFFGRLNPFRRTK